MICSDDNYLYQTAVLIESLILNNKDKFFNIYIVGSDLKDEKLADLISKFEDEKCIRKIDYICILDSDIKEFQISGHISVAAYYRIIALNILPLDVERIMYLDCDIIVNGDIESVYNIDFGDKLIVASEDKKISKRFNDVYENLQLNITTRYFNSGVIVFNVLELRKNKDFEKQLMDIATDKKIVLRFHDQDVLNKYFHDDTIFVESKLYNQIVKEIKNKKEAEWVKKNSIIIHYADRRKPWKHDYVGYLDDLWWYYERKLDGDEKYNAYRKKHLLYKYIPFRLLRKVKRVFKKDI